MLCQPYCHLGFITGRLLDPSKQGAQTHGPAIAGELDARYGSSTAHTEHHPIIRHCNNVQHTILNCRDTFETGSLTTNPTSSVSTGSFLPGITYRVLLLICSSGACFRRGNCSHLGDNVRVRGDIPQYIWRVPDNSRVESSVYGASMRSMQTCGTHQYINTRIDIPRLAVRSDLPPNLSLSQPGQVDYIYVLHVPRVYPMVIPLLLKR